MSISQVQVQVFLTPNGTIQIEAPGGANGSRKKVLLDEREWSEDDFIRWAGVKLLAELKDQQRAKRERDVIDAKIAAREASQRHDRIVGYAAEMNPTTLKFIESKVAPRDNLRKFLARQGYSEAEIASMSRRGELSGGIPPRRSSGFFTQPPYRAEKNPLGSDTLPL